MKKSSINQATKHGDETALSLTSDRCIAALNLYASTHSTGPGAEPPVWLVHCWRIAAGLVATIAKTK